MTKTKLQIMREKKGLINWELATLIYPADKNGSLKKAFDYVVWISNVEENYNPNDKNYYKVYWEATAQALGCSVDELVEE